MNAVDGCLSPDHAEAESTWLFCLTKISSQTTKRTTFPPLPTKQLATICHRKVGPAQVWAVLRSDRPAKRLKTLSKVEETVSAMAPTAENTLMEMPLDIIFWILRFMRPAELLALCHVNKGFRNLLVTDEKARLVWVGSREYHGIPEPFEDFDEYTWANLIFGRICTKCGEGESHEPDFGLMMRLCAECRRKNLCDAPEFYPDSDYDYVDLDDGSNFKTFPHSKWYLTRDEGWAPKYSSQTYWWAPYTSNMEDVVRNANQKVKGARKKLQKLREKGQRRFESKVCNKWRDGVEAQEFRARQDRLTEKFKDLGYQDPELDGLNDRQILAKVDLPLTEHAWTVIHETLEGSIRNKRRARLLKGHPEIMEGRQILAREAYMAYAATVLPKEATYLPVVADLEEFPEIRAICEREPDVDITISDFTVLPSVVVDWVANKRAKLTQIANSAETHKSLDRFNLAVTIFRCKQGHENVGRPAIFGGDEAMRHIGGSCEPELDIPLSQIASALVVASGLNPDTTSVADMDRRNPKFRCESKMNPPGCDKASLIDVFTWRGCITHCIEAHHYGRKDGPSSRPRIRPNTTYHKDGKVKFVRQFTVCGHCTKYLFQPETFGTITLHVNTVHGKLQLDASDVLLAPGVLSISKRCYSVARGGSIAVQPRSNIAVQPESSIAVQPGSSIAVQPESSTTSSLRCLRCKASNRKSKKFKSERSVRDHLKGLHDIVNGVRDVDYEEK
ncbi:hypothetical protein FB451DRAFT_1362562 [Mycena latifolia]|nr:hypothetical protein FB451DRAFT_1362562 [Mycena latifolia]